MKLCPAVTPLFSDWCVDCMRHLTIQLYFFHNRPLKQHTQLRVHSCHRFVSIPAALARFPQSPPFCPAEELHCDWMKCVKQSVLSVTLLVAEEGNGIKLPNWVIKGYFHPFLFLWAHDPNIDLAQVTLMKHVPLFHWFKSTYAISSSLLKELVTFSSRFMQLSPTVTVELVQF